MLVDFYYNAPISFYKFHSKVSTDSKNRIEKVIGKKS